MVRAQVWTFPTEMAATPLVSPITSTGVVLKLLGPLVPSPSSPEPLRPQHLTPPTVVRAQVWRFPAETLATPLVNATTSTGVVLKLGPPVPSSSWKLSLRPQHLTPPRRGQGAGVEVSRGDGGGGPGTGSGGRATLDHARRRLSRRQGQREAREQQGQSDRVQCPAWGQR